MMKIFGIAIALVLLLGIGASAGTIDLYIAQDFSLIAAPEVPLNPDPGVLFAGYYPDYALMRYDPTNPGYVTYPEPAFGGLLLGEAYWYAWGDVPTTVTYASLENGVPATPGGAKTDMWISLPGDQTDGGDYGGWHMIGTPYDTNVPVLNISVTNGTWVKPWAQAAAEGQCDSTMLAMGLTGYEPITAGTADVMAKRRGYWFCCYFDNLALIITAPP